MRPALSWNALPYKPFEKADRFVAPSQERIYTSGKADLRAERLSYFYLAHEEDLLNETCQTGIPLLSWFSNLRPRGPTVVRRERETGMQHLGPPEPLSPAPTPYPWAPK